MLNGKLPVINIEQPVECHVDTQGDCDRTLTVLFHSLKDGHQNIDDLTDIDEIFVIRTQTVLIERFCDDTIQLNQIHCKGIKRNFSKLNND